MFAATRLGKGGNIAMAGCGGVAVLQWTHVPATSVNGPSATAHKFRNSILIAKDKDSLLDNQKNS